MPRLSRRTVLSLLAAVGLGLLVAAPAAEAAAAKTVHLRGTAYEFGMVHIMLAGATIKVDEFPALHATVATDGTYDLKVPDRTKVTPYIIATGHHTIYLQTFTTNGQDLEHVNFQVPSDGIYHALASFVGVPLGADDNPSQCVIVSTFSTKNVRGVSYADFIAYGAHGIAGATASGSPALPNPIYFNENVIPDTSKTESSKDGGVLFLDVPTGVYTITAHHPTTRFASFVATCQPGRLINANPSWGLHELATDVPAKIAATWKKASLRSLKVTGLPADAVITTTCTGKKCPFTNKEMTTTATSLNVREALGSAAGKLGAGQTLQVQVSAPAFNTKVVRWTLGAKGAPKTTDLCVPLGEEKALNRCP